MSWWRLTSSGVSLMAEINQHEIMRINAAGTDIQLFADGKLLGVFYAGADGKWHFVGDVSASAKEFVDAVVLLLTKRVPRG